MISQHGHHLSRRKFVQSSFMGTAAGLWAPGLSFAAPPPNTNPTARLGLAWTHSLRWDRVVDIATMANTDGDEFWDDRLDKAQQELSEKGGGVVFFPPGEYRFHHDIRLRDRVILRGADPAPPASALDRQFSPPARLEFPKYTPRFTGNPSMSLWGKNHKP